MKPLAFVLLCLPALFLPMCVSASAEEAYTRTEDVIYGRKFGTALTMDVFTPKEQNGAAIVWVVSGGCPGRAKSAAPARPPTPAPPRSAACSTD